MVALRLRGSPHVVAFGSLVSHWLGRLVDAEPCLLHREGVIDRDTTRLEDEDLIRLASASGNVHSGALACAHLEALAVHHL